MIKKLKKLKIKDLKILSKELRTEIINKVAKNGGHIASSLGAVEIAIALHYVFDSPNDAIIWDVGHQAYAHKLLTGRSLDKLRKEDGISGFIKPDENKHDLFTSGHAGVSISEATGYAETHKNNFAIAVVGDGAMTAGMSYEALNHAGDLQLGNLIVIYNDNEMSISPNVGGISSFITKNITSNTNFLKLKKEITHILSAMPFQKSLNIDLVDLVRRVKTSATNLISPMSFFEAFGFEYLGPIDGHDVDILAKILENLSKANYNSPILLHVKTKKGMGFDLAEKSPSAFHGVSSFDIQNGLKNSKSLKYNTVFGNTLVKLASKNKNILAITPAMKEGSSLVEFAKKYPDRFYDVGIAEQHALGFAAGLAKSKYIPVVAIYSTFLQRAFDQVVHDIALNNEHIVFAVDRAGFVGDDGATHHGLYDITFLRTIPNITIVSPSTKKELEESLDFAINKFKKPIFIRYPRGTVFDIETPKFSLANWQEIKSTERSDKIRKNKEIKKIDITIFANGAILKEALEAKELLKASSKKINLRIYNASTIKPLDKKTILKETKNSKAIITIEEASLAGGFGSAILEFLAEENIQIPIKTIGISDKFIEQATQEKQKKLSNIDAKSIKKAIENLYKLLNTTKNKQKN